MKTFVCLALLFVAFVSAQTSVPCTGTVNGTEWDLSGLTYDPTSATAPTGYSLVYTDNGNQNTFYVNFCDQVSSTAVSADCNKGLSSGSCQLSGSTYFPAGNVPSMIFQTFTPDPSGTLTSGVAISYSGTTSYCQQLQTYRSTVINVGCDESAGQGALYAESANGCAYELFFKSEYGCAGGSGGGGGGVNPGWIIIFICCVAFFVYVAVGMVIKFVKFEARGLDIVPNTDFWKDVPALFKGGCVFFIQKITCGKVCSGYAEI